MLSPRSTAKREPLPPTSIGDGTVVSTGAIVFAGSTIGARVILGDQSCVRERVTHRRRRRARPWLVRRERHHRRRADPDPGQVPTSPPTRPSRSDVFVAPCVVTTNDNFMGRTERRRELMKGPTIRRGARIGGGAVLCPGIEVGEEAFVGAGAVVTRRTSLPRSSSSAARRGCCAMCRLTSCSALSAASHEEPVRAGALREQAAHGGVPAGLRVARVRQVLRPARSARSRTPALKSGRPVTASVPGRQRPRRRALALGVGERGEQLLAAPHVDGVDVVLVVPEVEDAFSEAAPSPP